MYKDGECQSCWQVQHDRTWTDMSIGCRNCGDGVVIPCWALPGYTQEKPQGFNKSPWWSASDVSGLYEPQDVAETAVPVEPQTDRQQPESTQRGLAARISRVLRSEIHHTPDGGWQLVWR